jgi:hypothetical protein
LPSLEITRDESSDYYVILKIKSYDDRDLFDCRVNLKKLVVFSGKASQKLIHKKMNFLLNGKKNLHLFQKPRGKQSRFVARQ